MAYHGGFLGSKALIDAFNPWDLMKAVGRAFRWLFVGRRTRMEDISYKTSSRGTHLEPTRNQFTAFGTGGHSLDNLSTASHAGPYQPFRDEGDSERLLSHTQEPVVYPRPMERAPYINSPRGDIGKVSLPYDRTRRQGLGRGYVGGTMGGRGLEGQDTGYHGAKAPVPPPDSYPLGPLGRERHARHDENIREGPTECERYLGAGHGVRDNRF